MKTITIKRVKKDPFGNERLFVTRTQNLKSPLPGDEIDKAELSRLVDDNRVVVRITH